MRLFITLFFLILFSGLATAQSYKTTKTAHKKAVKLYQKASALSRSNKNDKALKCFDKALKIEPTFINAKIKRAAIKYDANDIAFAEKELEEVIQLDPYYNTKLLYTLAVIKKKTGKYGEAKKYYNQYINAPKARESLVAKAKKGIEDVKFMASNKGKNPSDFNVQALNSNINTQYREYFPALSADGETFFFTRVTRNQEDIMYSVKKDGDWSIPKLVPNINTDDNEGNQTISADGKFLAFTACNRKDEGYGSCDIYFSEFKKGKWTPVRNIGSAINGSNWDAQPSISADGNTIYFTSKRTGGKGKSDIYVSHRQQNGRWSKATLIKGAVNTTGDEQTPFIHQDGQTLYFKSTGHAGLGGFDIFVSKKQADGTWGKPTNLGSPINSNAHEGSFIVSLDGKTAYFDSDRKITEQGASLDFNDNLHDIYSFPLAEKFRPAPVTYVRATVIDAETKRPLVANTEFVDLQQQRVHAASQTDTDGAFLVTLPYGKNYGLNVSKEGYLFHSENFALTQTEEGKPYELTIALRPIPEVVVTNTPVPSKPTPTTTKPTTPKPQRPTASAPIVLKNIFFASGSATLKPSSNNELNRLYDLLMTNPNMRIQINGHTDNVGSEESNLTLSSNRAKAVYNYLINKGINSQRLKYKGFGESMPIDTNDTNIGKQNNRRTEFELW